MWGGLVFPPLEEFSTVCCEPHKDFSKVNEADVSLELSCFFDDPMDVGNLISGVSTFSISSLNIWKFSVLELLKPSLENFEHYFASVWDECNCVVVLNILWNFLSFGLKWKLTFSSLVATAESSKFARILSTVLSHHCLLVSSFLSSFFYFYCFSNQKPPNIPTPRS